MRFRVLFFFSLLLSMSGCSRAQGLPQTLLVNGRVWKIQYVKTIELATKRKKPLVYNGATTCSANLIEVSTDQSEVSTYETLVHEIQHAMTCEGGKAHNEKFNNLEIEAQRESDFHSGIYWATPRWIQFIQDNPAFIKRLIDLKPSLIPDGSSPYF